MIVVPTAVSAVVDVLITGGSHSSGLFPILLDEDGHAQERQVAAEVILRDLEPFRLRGVILFYDAIFVEMILEKISLLLHVIENHGIGRHAPQCGPDFIQGWGRSPAARKKKRGQNPGHGDKTAFIHESFSLKLK
jgi:hypothetical protein